MIKNSQTSQIIVEFLGAPGAGKVDYRELVRSSLRDRWNTEIWELESVERINIRDNQALLRARFFLAILHRHINRIQQSYRNPLDGFETIMVRARFLNLHFKMLELGPSIAGFFLNSGMFHHFADEICEIMNDEIFTPDEYRAILGKYRGVIHLVTPKEMILERLESRAKEPHYWNYKRVFGSHLDEFIDSAISIRAQLFKFLQLLGYWTVEIPGITEPKINPEVVTIWEKEVLRFYSQPHREKHL